MVSLDEINSEKIVSELSSLFEKYEQALRDNDVGALQDFFWPSPHALRFGATEELYGTTAIEEFRKNRVINFTERKSLRQDIVALGNDLGIATLEFSVKIKGKIKHGRQSQVWVRFEKLGWRIVSAHVSHKVMPSSHTTIADYTDQMSAMLGVPIAPEFTEDVIQNLSVIASVANPLMAIDLPETIEPAPEYEP